MLSIAVYIVGDWSL